MKLKKTFALLVIVNLLTVSAISSFADENKDSQATEIDVVPITHEVMGEGFFITRTALEEIAFAIEEADIYKDELLNLRNDLSAMNEQMEYWKNRYERTRTITAVGFTVDTVIDLLLAGGLVYMAVTE